MRRRTAQTSARPCAPRRLLRRPRAPARNAGACPAPRAGRGTPPSLPSDPQPSRPRGSRPLHGGSQPQWGPTICMPACGQASTCPSCSLPSRLVSRLASSPRGDSDSAPLLPPTADTFLFRKNSPWTSCAFTGKSLITSKPLVQPEPFQSAHQWPICDFSAPKPANPHDTAVRDGVGAAGPLVLHELFCPHIADRAPHACGHKSVRNETAGGATAIYRADFHKFVPEKHL